MKSKPTTVLLAIIAALLGLNFLVGGSTPAAAQVTVGPVPPTVVSGVATESRGAGDGTLHYQVFRFWSDGTVDESRLRVGRGNPGCDVVDVCGPVQFIPAPCPADVNDDLSVNVLDLIDLLLVFGSSCPAAG